MSMTMSRPTLPSLTSQEHTSSAGRQLPPLSTLLNQSHSEDGPVSPPSFYVTDLSTHKITEPTSMKTPIRLPSFDSLKFESQKQSKLASSLPQNTSIPQSSSSISDPTTSFSQALSPVLPTPMSQLTRPHTIAHSSIQDSPLVEKRSFAFISHSPSTFPNQEPSIDNAQLARRKRRRTTPRELAILQQEFEKGSTPNRSRRVKIANMVDMTEKAVQIWFQNRRQSLRRQTNSEKEVHHLSPVYHSQPQASTTAVSPASIPMTTQTPIRPQTSFYTTSNHHPHLHQPPIAQTALQEVKLEQPSSSPQLHQQQSTPIKHTAPKLQNLLVTPLRTPRQQLDQLQQQSPMVGSTLTFKINTTPTQSTKEITTKLTPVQPRPNRQKPVMKVNPTPFRSAVESNKENQHVSPLKSKDQSPFRNRRPLQSLSLGNGEKPESKSVANFLNSKNWN